jgi:excisionase family DNA binding protein
MAAEHGKEESLHSTNGPDMPQYVSVGFIAKRCGVSNTTVLRWIGSGRLPAFRLPGGHYRIDWNAFRGFLTGQNATRDTKPF